MSFWSRLLGGSKKALPKATNERDPDDPVYAQTYAAMTSYWTHVGTPDPDVIAYILSPQFQGAPAWPTTRQAFRVVRREDSVILASDGLADPFIEIDIDQNGFEVEVFIETQDLQGADFEEIHGHWAFAAIEMWAQNVAHMGDVRHRIDNYGVISMALPIDRLPSDWTDANGNVGCLINIPAPGISPIVPDMPLSEVRTVALTLIRPDELNYVVDGRADARAELVKRLQQAGHHHITDLGRDSVV